MRYYTEISASADKLNLYTIWVMMACARKILEENPGNNDNWFLDTQVKGFLRTLEWVQKEISVKDIKVDKFTLDFILSGLSRESQMCMADSDVTCYHWEYSQATDFLRDQLAERIKC